MKVLVAAHRMEIGGTQVLSVELAASIRDRHGVDIVYAATPGPTASLASDHGLQLRPLPAATRHPTPARVRALSRLARDERVDLVHAWDWPQCFDCYPGTYLRQRIPMLCTVMPMVLPSFIPRQLPTTLGTEQLARQARAERSGWVHLLEPPVDTDGNAPGVADAAGFRRRFGIRPDETAIMIIGRLEYWLKYESLVRSVEAADALADRPIRLVIVGDGSAASDIRARAARVNADHGREVITLTGGLVDPRPAYEAADLMLGMGASALRALAFAKPLIVLGERGFSRVFDASTVDLFCDQGWYGLGDGVPDDLVGQIKSLLDTPDSHAGLGALGRDLVLRRYALTQSADRLYDAYRRAADTGLCLPRDIAEGLRAVAMALAGRAPQPLQKPLRALRKAVAR
jgi:glycosyltransferase involved in cell wall biosynthesis